MPNQVVHPSRAAGNVCTADSRQSKPLVQSESTQHFWEVACAPHTWGDKKFQSSALPEKTDHYRWRLRSGTPAPSHQLVAWYSCEQCTESAPTPSTAFQARMLVLSCLMNIELKLTTMPVVRTLLKSFSGARASIIRVSMKFVRTASLVRRKRLPTPFGPGG